MTENKLTPFITRRVSIKWGDAPCAEHTSTLVLTSPEGRFVDMRVDNDAVHGDSNDAQMMGQKYNWFFAGQAHKFDGGRASWDHWIDSKTDAPAEDAGVMSLLPNGDTLEKGAMLNDDGVKEAYEEVWRDEVVEPEIAAVLVRLRDTDLRKDDGSVLPTASSDPAPLQTTSRLESTEGDLVCGVVIRVGRWCQGLVKIDGRFLAERWHQSQDTGKWTLVYRMGDTNNENLSLPCSVVFESSQDAARPKIGQELNFRSQQWKYVEIYG
ncbi:hypothetical protein SCHPADRAFT_294078 [Schizopora paradoxa]|uniref:Protein HRI1 n=1 Tax=Schizopora paradoxa TaxID=27342 RepID=A0A0H2SCY9_9AGAM|nr:hypothetical protein SCHPADRAFT_294078 [Schizopora paradoxa]